MKKFTLYSFLAIIILFFGRTHISKATLFDHKFEILEGVFKEVQLPFPYRSFEEYEKDKIRLVHQGEICTFDDNNTFDFMYTGPLGPCIGIIVKNVQTNKVLLAHKDYLINIQSIEPYIKKMDEMDAIEIIIFSVNIGDSYGAKKWHLLHEGRSQKEEVTFIKKYFVEDLKISKEKVKKKLYTPHFNSIELGQYTAVERYIVVNRQGEIFTTSLGKEKLFVDSGLQEDLINAPQQRHLTLLFLNLYKLTDQFARECRQEVFEKHSYGDLGFVYRGPA